MRLSFDNNANGSLSLRGIVFRVCLTISAFFGLPAQAHLLDDFGRADAAAVGDGWIEKNPDAFALAGNRVVKLAVPAGYRDNIVYRPANEDVLDVEAAAELTFSSMPPGYPQVLVRVQSATVANPDTLDGYILYVSDTINQVVLGRQNGNEFVTTLATLVLDEPFNTTDRFRLRLSAIGANPVLVTGYVERLSGNVWEVIGQALVTDSSPQQIATAGSVGFSGFVESSYAFDNFVRVDLGAVGTANPAPSAASLSPTSATTGGSGLSLTVYGSGFTTDSVGRWNGDDRPTFYVSPSEIELQLGATDLASAGTANVSVFNPAPNGGTSSTLPFIVTSAPAPTLAQLEPASAYAGDASIALTVMGTGFDGTSQVQWNGSGRPTTYVSPTQLTATISFADLAAHGTAAVSVRRESDGTTTAALPFTISAPAAPASFIDTFSRPDSNGVGNGWLEKTPGTFAIAGNQVVKLGPGAGDYRNNVVYRPSGDDLLDVEASVEVRFTSMPAGYPQVFVRGQSATIGAPDTLDAYLLFIDDSVSQAILTRHRANGWGTPLATLAISPALNTEDLYRLRLRATGTNPVQVTAYIERAVGSAWELIAHTIVTDSSPERIASAGSSGFGGFVETNYRYDNFTLADVSEPNPLPSASALSPSSAATGSNAINLVVTGSNFVPGAVVRWNGLDRDTTYASSTQLTAVIPASDFTAQGTAAVTVFNPLPGGGTSNALTFTVTAPTSNPSPAVGGLAPSAAVAGSEGLVLTVTGSDFVPSSTVQWNGVTRPTTYVSAGELRATLTAADLAEPGSVPVTVSTPAPGGGTSVPQTFAITEAAPAPTISALSPSGVQAGAAGFTLAVLGNNFANGSTIRWDGVDLPTTYVSPTQLNAEIDAAAVATTGTRTITVFTPAPGGGTSNAATFTVGSAQPGNPIPVLAQLSPMSRAPGSSGFTLTVLGSSFTDESVVLWNGAPRPTTFVSDTELQAGIGAIDLISAGLSAVMVATPGPGGGTSSPLTFFVQDEQIELFFDGFNRPDSASVGPGWAEKSPEAFVLSGSAISSFWNAEEFMQNIVYRPPAEDRLDVEVSVEIVRLQNSQYVNDANFPQVHARVQRDTVELYNTLSSYIFYVDDVADTPLAVLAINNPLTPGFRSECYLAAIPLPGPLAVGERYRLRLRVTGTNPVQLWGGLEWLSNGQWVPLASGTAAHDSQTQPTPGLYCDGNYMPPPIVTPGSVGFSKYVNRTDTYDNFFWRDVDGVDLPPVLMAIAPDTVAAGTPGATITLIGNRFNPDSTVRWNGSNRTTTYVSSTELRVDLTSADLAQSGSGSLTVFDSSTGAGSNTMTLTISPGTPVVTLADDFDRADSAAIGNGWIEKTAEAFSLTGGRVQKEATPGGDYRNNLVYRPGSEAWLDSEASVELRVTALPVGYPLLAVRVQPATVANDAAFDGYLLYLNNSTTQAVLSRQRSFGGYDTPLATLNLTEALQIGGTYRMQLSATGAQSVRLSASIERLNGAVWETIGEATVNDASVDRLSSPGVVAFGGDIESAYQFDAFRRVDYIQ